MEDLLRVQASLAAVGAVTVTKAVGVEVLVPFAARSPTPSTAADFAVRALQRTTGLPRLSLSAGTLATLTYAGDSLRVLGDCKTVACDTCHNPDATTPLTRGGVIKGFTPDGACHTLATFTTTSECSASWAWAFNELHLGAQKMGFSGFRAQSLLHDCVPSVFAAVACVLPSITSHHYCSYHSISALEDRITLIITTEADIMDPDLRAGLAALAGHARTTAVKRAIVEQRKRIVHAWNKIILATNVAGAALLLQGFLELYSGNAKLMRCLCSSPYNDLDAILLCLSTSSRAIDAVCELFMRLVRQLQRGAQGARCKMKNFGGVVLLLAHAFYDSLASEADRAQRVERSLMRRRPLSYLQSPTTAASHASSSTAALVADPAHFTLSGLQALATYAGAPVAALHSLPRGQLGAAFLSAAQCAIGGSATYARNFLDMAYTGMGTHTFEALLTKHLLGAFIVSPHAQAAFTAAMDAAHREAEVELSAFLARHAREAPEPAPAQLAEQPSAPPLLGVLDREDNLRLRLLSSTFGGAAPKRRRVPEPSAQVSFSRRLPPLEDYLAVGRPAAGSKEMCSTVEFTLAGQRFPVPLQAQPSILAAWKALPPSATVLITRIEDLYLRPHGPTRTEVGDEQARSAPARRHASACALLVAAMRRRAQLGAHGVARLGGARAGASASASSAAGGGSNAGDAV